MDHIQSLKELARHVLFRIGMGKAISLAKGNDKQRLHLNKGSLTDRFSDIYDSSVWIQKRGQKSFSGLGSEIAATASIRDALPGILEKVGCKTLLDMGCGDFNWLSQTPISCTYIGCDIVPAVIAADNEKYANESRKFLVLDATCETLPHADTVLCREVLFHLSFADIRRILINICDSGIRHLILTSDNSLWYNSDIASGDFRNINLNIAPFHFPEAEITIDDSAVRKGRHLGVWKTDVIRPLLKPRL